MANPTNQGYPSMDDTDPLADVADLMEALAEAVNDRIGRLQSGSVTTGTLVAGTPSTGSVVFAEAYPASGPVPEVFLTQVVSSGLGSVVFILAVSSVTRTGFTWNARRDSGTAAMSFQWLAKAAG